MFFVGAVHSDMLLYYKRGEVSMGLLYCGANIQPAAAAEVCDDGGCWLVLQLNCTLSEGEF